MALAEAMKTMKGVGRAESIALASYLQRSVLRTEHLLDDIIKGGSLDSMKRGAGKEEGKMIDRVIALAKEAKGKSAKETAEISGRMNAVIEALEKSGEKGTELVKGLKKSGIVGAVGDRGTVAEMFADAIKGKVEGFQDTMIRKLPIMGGVLADVRKSVILQKKSAADEKQKLGDIVEATEDTAEENKKQSKQGETEYTAGEEEREGKGKWKSIKNIFGMKGAIGKHGGLGAGGAFGGAMGEVLGNVFGKLPFGKILGPVVGGIGKVIGPLLGAAGPLALMLGVGLGAFWGGKQIFENWLGPMMDDAFHKDMEARANARKQEIKDVTVMTDRGEEQVYKVNGQMMSEGDAIKKLGGKENLEKALADPDSGVIKATVRTSAATGKVFGEGQQHFGSDSDLAAFNIKDAKEDAIARGEHGKKAAFLMNARRGLRNQEQFYLDIMSTTYPNKEAASTAEDAFETETHDTKVLTDTMKKTAKRLGLGSELKSMLKEYPLVSQAISGMGEDFKADTEFINDSWRVTGNLGSTAFFGDVTSEQYIAKHGSPSDMMNNKGSNANIAALVASNAMSKATGGGGGGGTVIAPTSNSTTIRQDTHISVPVTTRNTDSTFNAVGTVTYQQ